MSSGSRLDSRGQIPVLALVCTWGAGSRGVDGSSVPAVFWGKGSLRSVAKGQSSLWPDQYSQPSYMLPYLPPGTCNSCNGPSHSRCEDLERAGLRHCENFQLHLVCAADCQTTRGLLASHSDRGYWQTGMSSPRTRPRSCGRRRSSPTWMDIAASGDRQWTRYNGKNKQQTVKSLLHRHHKPEYRACMGMERPLVPSRPEKINGSIAPSISGRETSP